jgi:hypothetical protein
LDGTIGVATATDVSYLALHLSRANTGARLRSGNINFAAAVYEVPEGLWTAGINRVAAGLCPILPSKLHLTKSTEIYRAESCNYCDAAYALRLKAVAGNPGAGNSVADDWNDRR